MPQDMLDRTRITPAVRSILVDHLNIACVLNGLRLAISRVDEQAERPDFSLLFFALSYMERFSDAVHHPKEERFLFEALAKRRPDVGPAFEWLRQDHREGLVKLSRVRSALAACHKGDATIWALFRGEAEEYMAAQFAHMAREERELLPLALESLTRDDWLSLNQAFHHEDPLFGRARQREFDNLFAFIMNGCYGGPESARKNANQA